MSNCYSCANRRSIAGDCHSMCTKPGSDRGAAAIIMLTTGEFRGMIKGVPHGIRNGWFCWPFNFDPTWVEYCDFYTEKDSE